jgi:glucose uptake protein GlcU
LVAYKVVAFRVNVSVVENILKRNVGMVIVANVISQNRTPVTRLKSKTMHLTSKPNHDRGVCVTICLLANAVGEARVANEAIVELMPSGKLEELIRPKEAVPESDIFE